MAFELDTFSLPVAKTIFDPEKHTAILVHSGKCNDSIHLQ
jgi:hypothetical protein